jgi:hypothetical protein
MATPELVDPPAPVPDLPDVTPLPRKHDRHAQRASSLGGHASTRTYGNASKRDPSCSWCAPLFEYGPPFRRPIFEALRLPFRATRGSIVGVSFSD